MQVDLISFQQFSKTTAGEAIDTYVLRLGIQNRIQACKAIFCHKICSFLDASESDDASLA